MESRREVPTSLRRRRFCAHLFARRGERHPAGDRPSFASTGMADNLYGRADLAPTKELSGTVCRRAGWRGIVRRSCSVARPPPRSPYARIAGATVRVGAAPRKGEPRSEERATEGKPLPEGKSIETIEAKPIEPMKSIESIEGKPIEPMKSIESIEAKSIEPMKSIESIEAKSIEPMKSIESIEAKSIEPMKSI